MKKIEGFVVDKTCSLENAMEAIDANAMGFTVVCEGSRLFGIATDGDIRRYLLAGGNLKEPICNAANKNPYYVMENDRFLAENIMSREAVKFIPVVNYDYELVDIIWNRIDRCQKIRDKINIPLVIMAGGKGTRLRPYTDILPKPLIPVDGITITEQIMNRFSEYGCDEVYIIVNYMKDFIKAYFEEKKVRQTIHFVEEETFLGTGGGLKYIEGKVKNTFFMTNCDVLIDCNYADILAQHKEYGNIITMVCAKKNLMIPYGTIEIGEQNQILSMKEKPTVDYNINTGVYMIEPEFLNLIPDTGSIHLPQLIELAMQSSKKTGTYIIDEDQWMDMGQIEELEQMKYKIEQF